MATVGLRTGPTKDIVTRVCMLAPWSQGFPAGTLVLKGQSGNQGHKTQAPKIKNGACCHLWGVKVDTNGTRVLWIFLKMPL